MKICVDIVPQNFDPGQLRPAQVVVTGFNHHKSRIMMLKPDQPDSDNAVHLARTLGAQYELSESSVLFFIFASSLEKLLEEMRTRSAEFEVRSITPTKQEDAAPGREFLKREVWAPVAKPT